MSREDTILACLAAYMAVCIAVGIWALRRTRSTSDFFMAGRSLGAIVTGLAIFSSIMSGFGFVGGPGLVYQMGMSSVWIIICGSLGTCFSVFLVAKRLRLLSELRGSISLPDAIAARYNSELSRFLAALAIILGVIGYLGTQVKAMATVLKDILETHPELPEISIEVSMFISCGVLAFYCVAGGILAGVYTDVLQGAVMMVAGLLVFLTALGAVDGGLAGMSRTIAADDPEAILPFGTLGMLGCLSWYFLFCVGGAGQPHVITKFMMSRRVDDVKRILPLTILAYSFAALLWIGIGLAMRALVLQGEHAPLATADEAAPQFLQHYASPLLAGVVFAGLFAAIMSTADSFLNIGAAAWVHDIPRALLGRSLRGELIWARFATLLLLLAAALFALYSADLIALLGEFGWGAFAAALVPAVAIGFNWKRATATAVNVAMASSLVINFALKLFDITLPYGFSGGALSLLISLTLFFAISLLSKPKPLPSDIEAVMSL